jgi:hypothetical protein
MVFGGVLGVVDTRISELLSRFRGWLREAACCECPQPLAKPTTREQTEVRHLPMPTISAPSDAVSLHDAGGSPARASGARAPGRSHTSRRPTRRLTSSRRSRRRCPRMTARAARIASGFAHKRRRLPTRPTCRYGPTRSCLALRHECAARGPRPTCGQRADGGDDGTGRRRSTATRAVLHATDMAVGVYRRVGFSQCGSATVFATAPVWSDED